MAKFSPAAYGKVLRIKPALIFDLGTTLMRLFIFMGTIGTVSMLTLAGYSVLQAGTVSSVLAISTFLITPRVSKKIDELGQHKVLPIAGVITMIGLVIEIVVVELHLSIWFCYIGALLIGFAPHAPSIARARWTYLIQSGRLGDDAPDMKTAFSYEGVIDDLGFMVGPPASIALAAIHPTLGMIFGGIVFIAGTIIVTLAKSTEPEVGWDGDVSPIEGQKYTRSIILTSSVVVVFFFVSLLQGAYFGVWDTEQVAIGTFFGKPEIASIIIMVGSLISMVAGFLFGMIEIKAPVAKQMLVTALLVGVGYGTMCFVESLTSLLVITLIASWFFAPFMITLNSCLERCVPGSRITEAMTWTGAGVNVGFAIGPTVAGAVNDSFGYAIAFDCGAIFAILIPVVVFACYKIIKTSAARTHAAESAE